MKKLNLMITTGAFVSPLALYKKLDKNLNFHFYLIVSAQMKFIVDSFEKNGKIVFIISDGIEETELTLPSAPNDIILNYSFEYVDLSRTSIRANFEVESNGKKIAYDSVYSGNELYYLLKKEKTFNIEYIGQSYAGDGHRNVVDRLLSHSTLQKILTENFYSDKRKDIRLLLFNAENIDFKQINTNLLLLSDVPNELNSECVNLLEAFLINYFKPKYNIKFKDATVPTNGHSSYSQITNKKYESFCVGVKIQGSRNIYQLCTEEECIVINEGVSPDICKSFDTANIISPDEYYYSFWENK